MSDTDGAPREPDRKVGEVARLSGLTVRALRYYEEIGLLTATHRTEGGHRLYTSEDLGRLYRIRLLRQLGLPLAEIAEALDGRAAGSLAPALARHLAELDARMGVMGSLRGRLAQLLDSVDTGSSPATEELLDILEGMSMVGTLIQRRIGIVVYADLEAAYRFLVDVFGLGAGELTRDAEGRCVHGELQVGDGVIWLHPESPEFGLRSVRTLGAGTASVAVMVDDVDAHHERSAARGAEIVYGPTDQPYGYREYSARDLEGGLWSFMQPIG